MNKKMIIGALVVTSFFLTPLTTIAVTRDIVQLPDMIISQPEAEKTKKPIKDSDAIEMVTVIEQVENSIPTDSEAVSSSTAAEQIIIVTENAPASQIDNTNTLEDIKNTKTDFQIELWTGKKDGQYHIGNDLEIYLKVNKDSRVTIFDVGTSGKVHIIFPNEYQKDNTVKAGQTYRVPAKDAKWTFKLQGPAGKNILKAIATIEDVPLLEQTETRTAGIFKEINDSEKQLAKDISIALKPVNSMQWTEVGTELIIID